MEVCVDERGMSEILEEKQRREERRKERERLKEIERV